MTEGLTNGWVVEKISNDFLKKLMDLIVAEVGPCKSRAETDEKIAIVRSCLLSGASKMFVYERDHSGLTEAELRQTYKTCFDLNLKASAASAAAAGATRRAEAMKGFN